MYQYSQIDQLLFREESQLLRELILLHILTIEDHFRKLHSRAFSGPQASPRKRVRHPTIHIFSRESLDQKSLHLKLDAVTAAFRTKDLEHDYIPHP
jgi:hypothetical protein